MKKQDVLKMLKKIRKRLKKYADTRGFRASDLECLCAISSAAVFKYLKSKKLYPIFHENGYHCFVTCKIDNIKYYIDLTLRQFSKKYPLIYFKETPAEELSGWIDYNTPHLSLHKASTEINIRKILRTWPCKQNPFKQGKQLWDFLIQ